MKKIDISKKSQTDWKRMDSMREEDIDLSDVPEITPEMFAKAVVRQGLKPAPRKVQLTLRVDNDVLDWFKSQGRGYQTKINSLLRAYMEANKTQINSANEDEPDPAEVRRLRSMRRSHRRIVEEEW